MLGCVARSAKHSREPVGALEQERVELVGLAPRRFRSGLLPAFSIAVRIPEAFEDTHGGDPLPV